ncbi:MAG TPA: AI-2E family transporter [Candidatus Sulfotelmatobacter sp.]|nr:AI-2E family transporter [Candidatus Sulfotelmatobacter sp.]
MSSRAQTVFWIAATLVFLLLVYLLRSVLLPFVAGLGIAYLLDPLADRLERRGLSRTLATVVIVVVFFAILVLAVILLAPVIEQQVAGLLGRIPELIERARDKLLPALLQLLDRLHLDLTTDVKGAVAGSAEKAAGVVGGLLQSILGGSLAVINLFSLLLITPIVTFYMLRDWDRMVAHIDTWLPRQHAATIRGEFREIDAVLAGFVRGQAAVCLSLAVFYAVALSLAGLQYGLLIGLIAGALVFIPFAGTLFGLITAGAVAAIQFWPDYARIAIVLGVFLLGHAAESNFVTPRLVGEKVGLHPVWIIFALLAFGVLFGFVGVLLAVPLAAVIGVLVRFALRRYLASGFYLGAPPGQP